MDLFLSWSRQRSKIVAGAFNTVFKEMFPSETLKIFYSDEAIKDGEKWRERIDQELNGVIRELLEKEEKISDDYEKIEREINKKVKIIVFLTEENINNPWLLYEAGAILNRPKSTINFVCIDDSINLEKSPFKNRQVKITRKEEDIKMLLQSICNELNIAYLELIQNNGLSIPKHMEHLEKSFISADQYKEVKSAEFEITRISKNNEVASLKLLKNKESSLFAKAYLSWYGALEKQVIDISNLNEFTTSPAFYDDCLITLDESGVTNIKAVRDLSKGSIEWTENKYGLEIEKLWRGIEERIFVFKWEDLFNINQFTEIKTILNTSFNKITNNKLEAKIYFTFDKFLSSNSVNNINNMFFTKDDNGHEMLYGSYKPSDYGEKLHFEHLIKKSKMDDVTSEYENIFKYSYKFDKNINSIEDLLFQYLPDICKINSIIGSCSNLGKSDDNVFDINMRLWTPKYDDLLENFATEIMVKTISLHANKHQPIKILEIGSGTGTLTEKVLNHIVELNKPKDLFEFVSQGLPVEKYFINDCNLSVLQQLKTRLNISNNSGVYKEHVNYSILKKDYSKVSGTNDIIFGSFVLHSLVNLECQVSIKSFFESLIQKFNNSTVSALFLCTMYDDNIENNKQYIENWKKYMINIGLDTHIVAKYMKNNQSMLHNQTVNGLNKILSEIGLICEFDREENYSLFGVLKIKSLK